MANEENPQKTGPEHYLVRTSTGAEEGPFEIAQLEDLVKEGRIKATTMICIQSAQRWHLAASIPEVRVYLRKYSPGQSSVLDRIRAIKTATHDGDGLFSIERASTHIRQSKIFSKLSFLRRLFRR